MTDDPTAYDAPPPRELTRLIDEACDRFEADWAAGRRPRIEDALAGIPEPGRPDLLRELLKLDLVEARLSEPGLEESARLDALGVEVADAVAELCEKLPQRTLLCVFGDHGFRLDAQGEGTSALKQGGSRPEEVLVPAFAWLVGGVQ